MLLWQWTKPNINNCIRQNWHTAGAFGAVPADYGRDFKANYSILTVSLWDHQPLNAYTLTFVSLFIVKFSCGQPCLLHALTQFIVSENSYVLVRGSAIDMYLYIFNYSFIKCILYIELDFTWINKFELILHLYRYFVLKLRLNLPLARLSSSTADVYDRNRVECHTFRKKTYILLNNQLY